MIFDSNLRRLLLEVVGANTLFWLVVLLFTLLLAHLSPASPQISFAFAGDSGYAGIRLFDLDHRMLALLADTSSPLRAGSVAPPAYSWSPDGRQIVYEDRAHGTPRLMRMTIPGAAELLAEAPSGCNSPTWSKQNQIAYICGGILYLIAGEQAPDMRREFRAEQEDTYFSDPLWSPDGERLAHIWMTNVRSMMVRDSQGNEVVSTIFDYNASVGELLDWSAQNLLLYTAQQSWLPYSIRVEASAISLPQPLLSRLSTNQSSIRLHTFQWSPDNALAAYVQSGRPGSVVILDGQLDSIIHDISFNQPSITELTWSSDSQTLYANRFWDFAHSDIVRIDTRTGLQSPVTQVFDVRVVNLNWRPTS